VIRAIQAIFENGVLRPLEPLALPERSRVSLTIESGDTKIPKGGMDGCAGTIASSDAAEMGKIIAEEFEGVDERDW
jgi:predicted DNA-binding antitoxin AbrB/MazE fold protein